MRFKKAILIPIFIYTEEELKLKEIGIDKDDDSGFNETEDRAFWCIDYACQYLNDPKKTSFYVNGESFVTYILLEEFIDLINNHE